jgi:predicted kinase
MFNDMIMMIGPAGSGKSTWIKNYLEKTDRAYVVLSTDAIFVEWGQAMGLNYTEAFNHFKYSEVESEFDIRLAAAIAHKQNIIWDQTNLTIKSRAKKLARIPKSYKKRAVVFNLPQDLVKARTQNEDRLSQGKVIPAYVLSNMFKQFEAPDIGEFDEVIETITT